MNARIVNASSVDFPTCEDLLERLQALPVVLTELGVQPCSSVSRHASIGIEVASSVVEAFFTSDEIRAVETDRKELGCRFQDPKLTVMPFSVDPTSIAEGIEDRSKGFEPGPVRLTIPMRLMRIALGRVSQGAKEISLQSR